MASLLQNLQRYVSGETLQQLSRQLGAEAEEAGSRIPGGLGSILQLLDRNKSGSVMDEAVGMLGKFFGNRPQ